MREFVIDNYLVIQTEQNNFQYLYDLYQETTSKTKKVRFERQRSPSPSSTNNSKKSYEEHKAIIPSDHSAFSKMSDATAAFPSNNDFCSADSRQSASPASNLNNPSFLDPSRKSAA